MATVLEEINPSPAKAAKFETGWTVMHPMPMAENPADPTGPQIPEYPSTKAWFRVWLKKLCLQEERKGYEKLAADSATEVYEDDLD